MKIVIETEATEQVSLKPHEEEYIETEAKHRITEEVIDAGAPSEALLAALSEGAAARPMEAAAQLEEEQLLTAPEEEPTAWH